jgi:delta 1-pyrroline-5-carboxylate dehydrogenase
VAGPGISVKLSAPHPRYDAPAEVREVVDLCRCCAAPLALAGPTGEENQLLLDQRGRIAYVADDPVVLAAQIGAALVAGRF